MLKGVPLSLVGIKRLGKVSNCCLSHLQTIDSLIAWRFMGKKMIKADIRKHSSKHVLITGSSGLIGSQASRFFADLGCTVHGIDNDMRKYFFGNEASTRWNKERLKKDLKDKYIHY